MVQQTTGIIRIAIITGSGAIIIIAIPANTLKIIKTQYQIIQILFSILIALSVTIEINIKGRLKISKQIMEIIRIPLSHFATERILE